ncbi:hypothetical protein VFPFJ_03998 [Purpureocillium lilacinum]|uniref:Uncharacterized protein n=1 Tax=Purpureocillium lilacinum TaxID=33203 RepID=A0A179HRI5_PURLI|nr:hypothetical protein VFPFJ_03998 [Purpureocillium lilacinum]OAQ92258.1 hypothetical protein VFPFJ_03998 [Purpureocillium lilacinum]
MLNNSTAPPILHDHVPFPLAGQRRQFLQSSLPATARTKRPSGSFVKLYTVFFQKLQKLIRDFRLAWRALLWSVRGPPCWRFVLAAWLFIGASLRQSSRDTLRSFLQTAQLSGVAW